MSNPERVRILVPTAGGAPCHDVVTRQLAERVAAILNVLPRIEYELSSVLAAESDLHPREIRTALEFAARYPDDSEARIARNEQAIEEGQQSAKRRQALLA